MSGNCPDCVQYVFSKLRYGTDQTQFSKFISRYPPLLLDGTRSTLLMSQTCDPEPSSPNATWDAGFNCIVNYIQYAKSGASAQTIAQFFSSNPGVIALAVFQASIAQNPQGQPGVIIFFNPSRICTNSILPSSTCQINNQSTLFHEALHEFYDYGDSQIQTGFRITVQNCTANITDYIAYSVFNQNQNSCIP